jgi:hypothetical protein
MRSARAEIVAVIALLGALVAIGVVFGARAKDHDDPRRSTFVDSPRGLRALYLVLSEVGARPRRATSPLASSDPAGCTYVLASPSEVLTRRETAEIVKWVEAGGRLVLVCGSAADPLNPVGTDGLLAAFGAAAVALPDPVGAPVRVEGARLAEDLGDVDWPARAHVLLLDEDDDGPRLEPLARAGERVLAGRIPRGERGGEVVVLADARLLDNASLGRGDNAVLAVRLLLAREGDEGRVVFDEFHHGFSDGASEGHVVGVMLTMLHATWPGRALLVVAIAGLLWLAGAGVRFGAPAPEPPAPRRALSEHADALGRIFEKAAARRETLRILAAGARRVAGARLGIPGTLPPAAFLARLRSLRSPGAADLADAMEVAESGREAKDVHMAEAAANLARAKRRFLHGGE